MVAVQAIEVGRDPSAVGARGKAFGEFREPVQIDMDASVIERLAQANVLVVGDVLLDRYVEGRVSRISPEAPVPVLKHAGERTIIGAAGNVAANIIVLGGRATLTGIVGDDAAADEIIALCARLPHLDARLVRDAEPSDDGQDAFPERLAPADPRRCRGDPRHGAGDRRGGPRRGRRRAQAGTGHHPLGLCQGRSRRRTLSPG